MIGLLVYAVSTATIGKGGRGRGIIEGCGRSFSHFTADALKSQVERKEKERRERLEGQRAGKSECVFERIQNRGDNIKAGIESGSLLRYLMLIIFVLVFGR